MLDDEVTAQRELPELINTSTDDLDEETAVVQNAAERDPAINALIQRHAAASERARQLVQGPSAREAGRAPADQDSGEGDPNEGPTDVGITRPQHRPLAAEPPAALQTANAAAQTRQAKAQAGQPAQAKTQAEQAAQSAQAATSRPRLAQIPAVRVAVIPTLSGEVRLVALGEGEQAPVGAAAAILVPLNEGEGAAIAKLLGVS